MILLYDLAVNFALAVGSIGLISIDVNNSCIVGAYTNYYITKDQLKPLQVILRRLLDASRNAADQELVPTETLKMAAVCYATAPIIVVYPFIQKYFVKGTLAGAVKG